MFLVCTAIDFATTGCSKNSPLKKCYICGAIAIFYQIYTKNIQVDFITPFHLI